MTGKRQRKKRDMVTCEENYTPACGWYTYETYTCAAPLPLLHRPHPSLSSAPYSEFSLSILLIMPSFTRVPTKLQAYTEQVHTAPHGQKGKRFQAVTEKINSLEMFAEAGGVTQSRVEDVYRRIMTAHREKLLNGERMSGEFEGSPINSLEYLCHNIMREEEEYLSVKWGGSRAEEKQAAADKNEARVQEVSGRRRI